MSETKVPGIVAKHAIVSDQCRKNRGDLGTIMEAITRLRDEAMETYPHWPVGQGTRFHFVLTVEPAQQQPAQPPGVFDVIEVQDGPEARKIAEEQARAYIEGLAPHVQQQPAQERKE